MSRERREDGAAQRDVVVGAGRGSLVETRWAKSPWP
jgi:hypothetical protein